MDARLEQIATAIDPRYQYAVSEQNGGYLYKGDQYQVMDRISAMLEEKLGFYVNIDVDCDEEDLYYFLHSDNYDDMESENLNKAIELGLNPDDDSEDVHMAICELLNIFVEAI